ncbi:acyl-coenzyme A oxidase-like protein [Bos indicus x Bos taurus]|uniref:acyl-coenzyme A oxidase-like protein n=1 Tax=Bos indicus x Bos taurus TaxID=30522 RepID=UPI000F7D410E|nr:acyl-coenzyme A oxidase-like protein [Bos indicus x Bos taurus]
MRTLTFQRVTFTMGLPLLKRAIQDQVEKTRNFVSRSLVIGEVLSMADMATGVKCGIIYWLFGGAIRSLGGPAHVTQWLQPLQEQKYTGMFAMTERGHGSNVRAIQTEATFDFSAQEFVIDTPCKNAEKMYIGNAMYGNYAAVFAQLFINGRSQGPHCFIVPVRDENGSLYPGVTVVDMMHKEGLHGVDNGILRFDSVRIPRENLLDKFGSVGPDGQYHSPIKDKSARFNAMLAALTPSRLAVTFQAMGSMKAPRSRGKLHGTLRYQQTSMCGWHPASPLRRDKFRSLDPRPGVRNSRKAFPPSLCRVCAAHKPAWPRSASMALFPTVGAAVILSPELVTAGLLVGAASVLILTGSVKWMTGLWYTQSRGMLLCSEKECSQLIGLQRMILNEKA